MKQNTKKITAILLMLTVIFAFVSCGNTTETSEESLWSTALYQEDTEFGDGAKMLGIKVTAVEKSIVFTIRTDAETVGEALLQNGLAEGSEGPFGLYISHVNGIKAVYEEDGAYWGFLDRDGKLVSTGVDMTEFLDGDVYELRYTKE